MIYCFAGVNVCFLPALWESCVLQFGGGPGRNFPPGSGASSFHARRWRPPLDSFAEMPAELGVR